MKPPSQFSQLLATRLSGAVLAALLVCCGLFAQAPVRPQAPVQTETAPLPAFRAVTYDVRASISPADQTLSAIATVEFEPRRPSSDLICELHPNLRLNSIKDASGKPVEYERDFSNPLIVHVTLPPTTPAGQRIKLTFDYSGQLPNEQNGSPVPGVRVAWVGNQGAYLMLPGRWFPLTEFPSNRFTGTFRIEVPQDFMVVGTGVTDGPQSAAPAPPPQPVLSSRNPNPNLPPPTSSVPTTATANDPNRPILKSRDNANPNLPPPAPATSGQASTSASASSPAAAPPSPGGAPRYAFTFRVDRPEAAGTFVVESLLPSRVQSQGINVSVFTTPNTQDSAQRYADAVARIIETFSSQFGPIPQPNLNIAQIPDGTVSGYAAPGLVLVSQRHWAAEPDTRMLADLVASQWWGDQVMPASANDVWLTDGLARYSEALYIEQTANREAMNHALEDFAVGALMYEDAAPLSEAGRLAPLTAQYESVVVNKGAMVFHMLRAKLGDGPFMSLLKDFYAKYSGKQASLADFEQMAQQRAASMQPQQSSQDFAIRVNSAPTENANAASDLQPFFTQWVNSTGVPEFTIDYTVLRTTKGFRVVGKIKQPLPVFHADLELQIQTEGNPEIKMIEVSGTESDFDVETFGRPKAGGVTLDPHDYILKSSPRLRVRAIIARGEALAEQSRFYDAIQQYQQALDVQKNQALALFRMGEVFFYQKNYQAAANSFRSALDGDIDPTDKWIEVWSHIYLGKIFDISGDRTRAVNEYSRAQQTNDNTGGAQEEVKKWIAAPYKEVAG
jgi:hypothetical protein